MLARRFFYVASAFFLIAWTYHLGVNSARAQSGFGLTTATIVEPEGYFAAIGPDRVPHIANRSGFNPLLLDGIGTMAAVPGTADIILVQRTARQTPVAYAVLANGDVYYSLDGSGWTFSGNLTGAPTAVPGTTWGEVKSRYRK